MLRVWFVWYKKAWQLLKLNYTGKQVAIKTVCCVCVCREFHQREPSREQTWSLDERRQGPPPLWQTSAFALRPVEISNLCLTCRKGQAHPCPPRGVDSDHFLAAPSDSRKSWDSRYQQATVQMVHKWRVSLGCQGILQLDKCRVN